MENPLSLTAPLGIPPVGGGEETVAYPAWKIQVATVVVLGLRS